ncbi:MAG: twin-arginine translocase subunit TatB [Bacteroidales bacterium]|nr:twin-arginine translocase subunit TatB [Bacteroidales bacterium]
MGLLLFFDISSGELLVILVVAFLVFGPRKLPEMARTLGKGINELRRATSDIRQEIQREAAGIRKEIDKADPMKETETKTKEPENPEPLR